MRTVASQLTAMAFTIAIAAHVRIVATEGFLINFTTPCITETRVSNFTPDLTQELVLQKIIQVSHSTVYRGTLDGTPVVVKIAFDSDRARWNLRKEAFNYFYVEELQGSVIPRCYNYVIGSTPIKGKTKPIDIACLIFEDCGEPVEDFFCLKPEEKKKILDGLLTLHVSGFYHDDFEEKHVVGGSQGYRIISLKNITKHQCPWDLDRDYWRFGEYYSEDFPCKGLKNAGARMNIWRKDVGYDIASQVRILAAQRCHVDFTTSCITESRANGFTPGITQELVLQKVIHGSRSTVYRGTLDGTPVVVKIAFDDYKAKLKLRKEANNYFALEDLQGTVIPRCYNYVIGSTPMKGQTKPSDITCLILEDCGKSVKDFFCLKLKKQMEILNGLLMMHLSGFYHDDFKERHVVRGSQGYRIIGLRHISKHQCPWDLEHDDWNAGGYYNEDFPCEDLKWAGAHMNIWGEDAGHIIVLGVMFAGEDLDFFPPRDIVDCLVPNSGIEGSLKNVEAIKDWLMQFKKEMDDTPDCNIEELIAKYQANPPHIPDVCYETKIEFKKYIPKSPIKKSFKLKFNSKTRKTRGKQEDNKGNC